MEAEARRHCIRLTEEILQNSVEIVFACSAEAVLPMGLRHRFSNVSSVSLSLKLLGQRLRRRPDWREAAA